MINKKYILGFVAIIIICGFVLLMPKNSGNESDPIDTPPMIGGDRDEYGCLGSAGYEWDEEINACIRNWELDESQRKAARIAVDSIGYEEGLTIIQVQTIKCPGCFTIEIKKGRDIIKINLQDYKVVKKSNL